MRKLRLLKQGVWYGVRTRINNGEPLFRRRDALVLFARVFIEAEARFGFEVRGLCLEDDGLALFLKPADGLELPAIMKWVKQTFAARFNRRDGRTGHIWGDRYVSWVLEGEPEEGGRTSWAPWVRGLYRGAGGRPGSDPSEGNRRERRFFRQFPPIPRPRRPANPAYPPRAPP